MTEITARALIGRINRRLSKENEPQILRVNRTKAPQSDALGQYYIVNIRPNTVEAWRGYNYADLLDLAKQMKCA